MPQSTEGEGFPAQVSQAPSQAAFPGVPLETKHSMPFPAALTASGSGLRGQGTASRGMPTLQKLAFGGVLSWEFAPSVSDLCVLCELGRLQKAKVILVSRSQCQQVSSRLRGEVTSAQGWEMLLLWKLREAL